MNPLRTGLAAAVLAVAAASALAADVVVLKGGNVIALREPWVRKGNTAYLTRPDGTVLSVSVAEIDRDATAAARAAAAAPPPAPASPQAQAPATPADAVRSKDETPKARVRITDSDVSHPLDLSDPSVTGPKDKEKGKKELAPGSARVEISTYDQKKDGDSVIVSGKLRNPTQQLAENVNLNVTVLDEKGEAIESAPAPLSNGEIEPGMEVDFKVRIPVGDRIPATFRFAPTWSGPKPPPPQPNARPAGGQKASAGSPPRS